MFLFPDKIIQIVDLKASPESWFEGTCGSALQVVDIPASMDFKKRTAGEPDARVKVDATISVRWTDYNFRLLGQAGNRLVIRRMSDFLWEVLDVDFNEGVFGDVRTLDLRCRRLKEPQPPTGNAGERRAKAKRKVKRVDPKIKF